MGQEWWWHSKGARQHPRTCHTHLQTEGTHGALSLGGSQTRTPLLGGRCREDWSGWGIKPPVDTHSCGVTSVWPKPVRTKLPGEAAHLPDPPNLKRLFSIKVERKPSTSSFQLSFMQPHKIPSNCCGSLKRSYHPNLANKDGSTLPAGIPVGKLKLAPFTPQCEKWQWPWTGSLWI